MSQKLKVAGLKPYWCAPEVDELPASYRPNTHHDAKNQTPIKYGDQQGEEKSLYDYIQETGKLTNNNQENEKIALLKEGVEKYPDSFVLWHRLGRAYFFTQQYDDAIDALTKASRLKPNDEKIERDLRGAHRRGGSAQHYRHG